MSGYRTSLAFFASVQKQAKYRYGIPVARGCEREGASRSRASPLALGDGQRCPSIFRLNERTIDDSLPCGSTRVPRAMHAMPEGTALYLSTSLSLFLLRTTFVLPSKGVWCPRSRRCVHPMLSNAAAATNPPGLRCTFAAKVRAHQDNLTCGMRGERAVEARARMNGVGQRVGSARNKGRR